MQFPEDHERLIHAGLFKKLIERQDDMAIYDVKFPRMNPLEDYIGDDEKLFDILPFAINGAGDVWGYLCLKMPHPPVTLFYHDDTIAEEVAPTIESFFTLQIIYGAMYGTSEEHSGVPKGWTKRHALFMCDALLPLFSIGSQKHLSKVREEIKRAPDDYDIHPISETTGEQLKSDLLKNTLPLETFDWKSF